MKKKLITQSFQETQQFGREFAKSLKGGEVLTLSGDLGSGKTTFVQGLAKGLNITQKIISPTFIIMRTYERGNDTYFYHVDLYRIGEAKEVEGLGLLELLNDPKNIVVMEWPEKMEELLPDKRIDLLFTYLDDNKRVIEINSFYE